MNELNPLRIKKGEIFMTMTYQDGTVEYREDHNVIVDSASILMAQWAFSNDPPTIPGIMMLAVGTGGVGWDLQNPPPATSAESQLFTEIARTSLTKNYDDPVTFLPVGGPTNVVDFQASFTATQAVGALVEMGLFGGVGYAAPNGGYMVNAYNFPVWNKPNTATLSIVWRLTF
jgi:hypothetical protein